MTDNDIIKALECCGFDEDMCLDCPIQCDCEKDTEAMIDRAKAILDLINRQKAEIAKKDTEIDILIRKKETLNDEIAELKAEIERLKELLKSSGEYINNLEKEMMGGLENGN